MYGENSTLSLRALALPLPRPAQLVGTDAVVEGCAECLLPTVVNHRGFSCVPFISAAEQNVFH